MSFILPGQYVLLLKKCSTIYELLAFCCYFNFLEFQDNVDRTHDRPRGKKVTNPEHPTQDPEHSNNKPEAVNKRALQIVNRVRDKLTGRDFNKDEAIDVDTQVDLLIQQATSHANLCQAYIGW